MDQSLADSLSSALEYAGRGWHVFPCHGVNAGRCSCGATDCGSPGKHPLTKDGFQSATTNADLIRVWSERWPHANWAIRTGLESGLLVLDIDVRDNRDGFESLQKLGVYEKDLVAPCVATGGGGRHYYYALGGLEIPSTAGHVGAGVDVRAIGGYVIAPPSQHISGRAWSWLENEEMDLPPVPAWLLAALQAKVKKVEAGEALPEGSRHNYLKSFVGTLRNTGLGFSGLFAALQAENNDKCKPPLPAKEVREIAEWGAKQEALVDPAAAAHGAEIAEAIAPKPAPIVEQTGRFPAHLLQPGGILQSMLDYAMQTAVRPQPVLALSAALTTFGAVIGRKLETETKARSNLYIIGIAGSGSGKEAPRQAMKKILIDAGADALIGGDGFASGAGISSMLKASERIIAFTDEIGRVLRAVFDKKAAPHLAKIADQLLMLYSSANTRWMGEAYADRERCTPIDCPHLCLFGTATYETLWGGITAEACNEGFLARCLLLSPDEDIPDARDEITTAPPPADLVEQIKAWNEWQPAAGALAALHMEAAQARKTKAAAAIFSDYRKRTDEQARRRSSDALMTLWTRARQKAEQVALIHAASICSPENSVIIDSASAEYALALVDHSTEYAIAEGRLRIGNSDHERKLQSLLKAIGNNGCTMTELAKKWREVKARERNELLHELIEAGQLQAIEEKAERGRGRTIFRRVA